LARLRVAKASLLSLFLIFHPHKSLFKNTANKLRIYRWIVLRTLVQRPFAQLAGRRALNKLRHQNYFIYP